MLIILVTGRYNASSVVAVWLIGIASWAALRWALLDGPFYNSSVFGLLCSVQNKHFCIQAVKTKELMGLSTLPI
ncbi:hypothetical protein L195_g032128, partial [Trifolium pratense]